MNKTHLTVATFTLLSAVVTNICLAKSYSDEETQKFILVKEHSKESIEKKEDMSFSDYITFKNVVKATAVLAIAGATAGAGAAAGLQLVGTASAPSIAAGAAAGTGVGIGLAAGGGGASLAIKAASGL